MAWTASCQPRPPDQVSVWNSLLLHFKFWLLGENMRNGREQLGEVESSHVPTGGHLAIVDAEELSHWIDLRVQGTWETQLFSPQTEVDGDSAASPALGGVDPKKPHVSKEGLSQHRNMCQSTNVASLASVVQRYLTRAEKRTEAARTESIDSMETNDRENLATPEMTTLSPVSEEETLDRSGMTNLMPWVKFLWECYYQCCELPRTNSRAERLFHNIAQQALKFCMNIPETQQMSLDTMLVQQDAAIHIELWQEDYQAMENTHGLMSLSEKAFQAKILANYHQKLTGVFWKSVMISRTYCDLTRGVYRSSPQPPGPIAMPADQPML